MRGTRDDGRACAAARCSVWVAIAGVAAAGCGDSVVVGSAPTPPHEVTGVAGGSRLRPRVAVSGDAARFVRWWDTELDVGCSFRHAVDGTLRCLPTTWAVVFLDASCTEPALLTRCDDGRTDYGSLRHKPEPCDPNSSPGDPPSSMYRRTGPAVGAQTAYNGQVVDGAIECGPAVELGEEESLVPAEPVAIED